MAKAPAFQAGRWQEGRYAQDACEGPKGGRGQAPHPTKTKKNDHWCWYWDSLIQGEKNSAPKDGCPFWRQKNSVPKDGCPFWRPKMDVLFAPLSKMDVFFVPSEDGCPFCALKDGCPFWRFLFGALRWVSFFGVSFFGVFFYVFCAFARYAQDACEEQESALGVLGGFFAGGFAAGFFAGRCFARCRTRGGCWGSGCLS